MPTRSSCAAWRGSCSEGYAAPTTGIRRASIPRGTLAALLVGTVVYMTLPVFLSLRADPQTLIEDPLVIRRMTFWGDAILLGVWGATLSSALGSILGGPRVLQALATILRGGKGSLSRSFDLERTIDD